MAIFHGNAIPSAAGDFSIDNSCRFETSWLRRVNASGSAKTNFTVSFWFKRSALASGSAAWSNPYSQYLWNSDTSYSAGNQDAAIFLHGDRLAVYCGTPNYSLWPKRLFRDTSAWYHICVGVDSTQATNTNRVKVYINGVQEEVANMNGWADTSAVVWPTQNDTYDITNSTLIAQTIGGRETGVDTLLMGFSGYISEFHFIDGTTLDQDSFGESGDYGEWKPKDYTGSHGTTGYYLDFSTGANLGDDKSTNATDFTVKQGAAASDQMTDTPTNNFATANSINSVLASSSHGGGGSGADITSMTEGSLKFVMNSSPHFYGWGESTIGMSSGKWYCEAHVTIPSTNAVILGIVGKGYTMGDTYSANYVGGKSDGYGWYKNQGIYNNASATSYGSNTIASGDVVGIALDLDNNKLYFHQNGSYIGSGNPTTGNNGFSISAASTTRSGHYFFAFGTWGEGCTYVCNYGQDGTFAGNVTAGGNADDEDYGNFKYDVPAGFLALCSKNLPDCAITPSEHFNTVLWSGNTTDDTAITGVGFQPDFTWVKSRNTASTSHGWVDAVRGAPLKLNCDSNQAEENETTGLKSFDSDGFTLGIHSYFNYSGRTYVGWNWKANGSGSSNTDGSINTTATSANVTAGFSISTYTGNGTGGATVGHGLSKAPNLVIIKNRSDTGTGWPIGSIQPTVSMDFTDYLNLDATTAVTDEAALFHDTAPTSSVVTISTGGWVNTNTKNYVMYCWHNVEGFSKVGAYYGNGNADGSFIYTGFRPAFLLTKRTGAASWWCMWDSTRSTYNVNDTMIGAHDSAAEVGGGAGGDTMAIDFLSNGIKMRENDSYANNAEGYFYVAFAETPFKNANAR